MNSNVPSRTPQEEFDRARLARYQEGTRAMRWARLAMPPVVVAAVALAASGHDVPAGGAFGLVGTVVIALLQSTNRQ